MRRDVALDPGLGLGWVPVGLRQPGWIDEFGTDSGEVVGTQRFRAAQKPPADFPVDFPFIRGAQSTLLEVPAQGRRVMTWNGLRDGPRFIKQVLVESMALGWEAQASSTWLFGVFGGRVRLFSRHAQLVLTLRRRIGRGWACEAVVESDHPRGSSWVIGVRGWSGATS